MSETTKPTPKHTPGPWTIAETVATFRLDRTVLVRPVDHANNEYGAVAAIPIGKQNAPLIAAAPDLFDLLQFAVARIELANSEGNPILSAWLPDATALLAKLTD